MNDPTNPSKEDAEYLRWLREKYAEIVFTYIDRTTEMEYYMNHCLASHFTPGFGNQTEKTEELVDEVIMQLNFQKKYQIFINLISGKYPKVYKAFEQDLKLMENLYNKRNDFSHSTLDIYGGLAQKKNKTKIGYLKSGARTRQPRIIKLSDFEIDKVHLNRIIDETLILIHQFTDQFPDEDMQVEIIEE